MGARLKCRVRSAHRDGGRDARPTGLFINLRVGLKVHEELPVFRDHIPVANRLWLPIIRAGAEARPTEMFLF